MKKFKVSCLALLCLIMSQCQRENVQPNQEVTDSDDAANPSHYATLADSSMLADMDMTYSEALAHVNESQSRSRVTYDAIDALRSKSERLGRRFSLFSYIGNSHIRVIFHAKD